MYCANNEELTWEDVEIVWEDAESVEEVHFDDLDC